MSELDFSSKGNTTAKVGSIESFLEIETPQAETPKEEVKDPLDQLLEKTEELVKKEEEKPATVTPIKEEVVDTTQDELVITPATEEKETVEVVPEKVLDYKKVISSLIEKGTLEKIDAFETEEGDVPFEDMEIDEDIFLSIVEQKLEEVKQTATKDKVSLNENSEFTKKLIEIEKNGGSVQDALQLYQEVQNPLENINLDKESDQQAVVYMHYKNKGLSDAEALNLIKSFKSEGTLSEKAVSFKEDMEGQVKQQLEQLNQDALMRKEQHKKALKDYRTSLVDSFQEIELNPSLRKKLIDVASKPDKEGRFELDSMYNQIRKDPAQVAELTMYLADREAFLKYITTKETNKNKLSTFKKMKIAPKRGKSPVEIEAQELNKNSKKFVDLDILK